MIRMLYIGPDDKCVHLEHGRHYHVTKKQFKNGKVRITIEETGAHKTYKDDFSFKMDFLPKKG